MPSALPSSPSPSDLPTVHRHITTHNDAGKAIIYSSEPGHWQSMRNDTVALDLVYTTSEFPAQLTCEADIKAHESRVAKGGTGLAVSGGSVCRLVDFGPDNDPMMHRTKSLDYGVVLEGEVEMILDSGEVRAMKRGDIAVQRGTMHAWKNPSKTQWARMMFVLLDCHPIEMGGAALKEALAPGQHEIPASGNDG